MADNAITDPAGEEGDDAILAQIKQWWKDSDKATGTWRDNAREDYAFVAGDQWSEADKAKLTEQLRPCVTFNRVGPTLDAVSGMEVNNRQEVTYLPRTEGDAGVNEVLTGAAKWLRDGCDAEDEESDAFLDTATCGMGWTETRLDFEADPEGTVTVSRIDPLEMWWDSAARKRNLDDGRYVIRARKVAIAEARALFPDAEDSDLDASGWAKVDRIGENGEPHDATQAPFYQNDQGSKNVAESAEVTLVECQWWEREAVYRVVDGTETTTLTSEQFAKLKKRLATMPPEMQSALQATRQMKRVFKRAFVGRVVLAPVDTACDVSFTYRCITAKRDRNNNTWYGLVKAMKDPQKWANAFFSTTLHHIQTSGKGIMASRDLFDNPRKAEEDWAKSDSITWLKPGADASKILPKAPSSFPPQIAQMMEFAVSSIRDVTGVNLEMLGLADRQQAGVLEAQRTKAGMTILATLFDSLRRYRKEQGRLLLWYIVNFLSDGRLVRIVGDQGAKYVPLVKDPATVRYDVIVDDSPTSPNQKEATWAILQNIMPALLSGKIPLPPDAWGEIIKQSPLPDSFSEKMVKIITDAQQKQAQQPPPPDPELVKAQAKIQADQQMQQHQMQSDQAKMAMEAQRQQQDMGLKQQQAAFEAELKKAELAFEMEMEKARLSLQMQMDHQRAQHEHTISQQKAQHETSLSEQRFNAESDLQKRKLAQDGAANGGAAILDTMTKVQERVDQALAGLQEQLSTLAKPREMKVAVQRGPDGRVAGAHVVATAQ